MNKLNDIPDKNPFKVPDNYFEDVNRKIIFTTSGQDRELRKVSIHHRLRTTLLIAASFAGFILIGYTALRLLAPDKRNAQVSEVLQQMNPDSFINEIDILALEEDAASLVLTEEGSGVSKNDIIDYLILDNIEINEIYEKL
jgi:hypothetical protein